MKTLLPMTLLASTAVLADTAHARLPPAVQVAGQPGPSHHDDPATHAHLGMWVTEDGHIRHELLPNGRYDEQRGKRKSAYQGRYWVLGDRIWYLDDTGFTADGQFRGDVFLHGGYVFRRVPAGQTP